MPNMDGMQVLGKVKSHPNLKALPVVMLTAATAPDEVREGIDAGAYYYLAKPAKRATLLTILRAAIRDYTSYRTLQERVLQYARSWRYLQSGTFHFRDLDEAQELGGILANGCPDAPKVVTGLVELLINAVEHGNLQTTYE